MKILYCFFLLTLRWPFWHFEIFCFDLTVNQFCKCLSIALNCLEFHVVFIDYQKRSPGPSLMVFHAIPRSNAKVLYATVRGLGEAREYMFSWCQSKERKEECLKAKDSIACVGCHLQLLLIISYPVLPSPPTHHHWQVFLLLLSFLSLFSDSFQWPENMFGQQNGMLELDL